MSSLIGKRKKSRQKQPNPLFIKWLQEWRDDAASKGNKSQFTYSKAFSSLKKYPVRLESGKDCKMLEGFGDKICSMLDKKLSEYVAENGCAYLCEEDSEDLSSHVTRPTGSLSLHCISEDSDSEQECAVRNTSQARRRPQAARDTRDYVPAFRSGPYAIISALYQETQLRGESHLSKKDLMRLAQPLADKSFTVPDPGSRYTAWSSMGSLIRKGLVMKENNPAKYRLTDSGKALGLRLLSVNMASPVECSSDALHFTIETEGAGRVEQQALQTEPELPSIHLNPRGAGAAMYESYSPATKRQKTTAVEKIELSDSDSDDMQVSSLLSRLTKKLDNVDTRPEYSRVPSVPSGVQPSACNTLEQSCRLKFSYVSDTNQTVRYKDQAAVLIEDDFGVGFLVKATYEDLLLSGMKYQLDTSQSGLDGLVYAYLHNDDAPDQSSRVTQEACPEIKITPKAMGTKEKALKKSTDSQSALDTSSQLSFSSISTKVLPPRVDSQTSLAASSTADSQGSVSSEAWLDSLPPPDFTLWPDTFQILLLVDNQEVYGAGSSKTTLISELRKNKVSMEVRNLQIGDFLWIARPKLGSDIKSKELVLDYIIERKRMDDLASSIIDGRFREQKFRLKNCGLKNPIYLVEDYGSVQHFSIDKDALGQAVVNTQIIDGFYIKRTGDIKESVAYLTMMTRYLDSFYKNKTIHACSKEDKDKQPTKVSFADKDIRLVTFVEFDRLSVKTRKLTIREMFGKQLVQIQGVTVEKAAAIVEKYPTVTTLMEAYSQCVSTKDRENLLCSVKFGAMSRAIGQVLSKQLYWLFSRENLQ